MDETDELSVNDTGDVSTTDANTEGAEQTPAFNPASGTWGDAIRASVAAEQADAQGGKSQEELRAERMNRWNGQAQPETKDANAAHVDDEQVATAQQSENTGEDATGTATDDDGREPFIPRPRFDQVNGEKQSLLAEKTAWEAEKAEFAKEREDLAFSKRALAAGYYDTEAFRRADEWAAANDYGTAENAIAAKAEMDRYAADRDREVAEGYRTQADRDEMVANKQLAVQAQAIANAAQMTAKQATQTLESIRQEQANYNRVRETDIAIAAVKAQADAAGLNAEQWGRVEGYLKKLNHPEAIKDYGSITYPTLTTVAKTAADNALIAHNARRAANGNGTAPPEGRGGGTAPPQLPKMTPQEAKSRSLSELLGFRK